MKTKFPKKKYKNLNTFVHDYQDLLFKTLSKVHLKKLDKAVNLIEKKIKSNSQIFVCGNGGSAAISNHYIADYLKSLRTKTKLKPKFISLASNLELITAISNDMDYSKVFSYQLESLANSGDIVIIISSSGNSKNIINLIKYAKKKKIKIIGFTGFDGGYVSKKSDISIHVDIKNYGISEDIGHILMHIIMQFLRQKNLLSNIKKTIF
jgi:D-sedoheptulose 7-phosphate isomerase